MKKAADHRIFFSFCFVLIIILFATDFLWADYAEDIAAVDAKIAASQTVIDNRQGLINDSQAAVAQHQKSIDVTKDILKVGLDKYKAMESHVNDIKDKFNQTYSNLFVLRSSYSDFYNAFTAYKDAWYAKREDLMNIEYKKMWHYLHGFESEPPFKDPVIGYWDVRRWALSVGARWSIRTLHTVVSTINVISTVVDVKAKVSGTISAANEGFKALLQYASDEAIDTVKENTIEQLKEAGADTSTTIEKTIAFVDAASSPLSAAEGELKKMVDRIEKAESFGYASKEEAIEKLTEVLDSTGGLYDDAKADAATVLAELQPIKTEIANYHTFINNENDLQQAYRLQIAAEEAKIAQYRKERAEIHYTYHTGESGCSDFVTHFNVAVDPGGDIGSSVVQLSLDNITEAFTGRPTSLTIEANADYASCAKQTFTCKDENQNDLIVNYNDPYSFNTELGSNRLGGSGDGISFTNGTLWPTRTGTGSYTFTMGPKFTNYQSVALDCNKTSYTPQGAGELEKVVNFDTVQATGFFLIPKRYKVAGKPIAETFPTTYHTFFNTSESPWEDEDYYFAYKLTGETNYQYRQVDDLVVTVTQQTTHPDGIISGTYTLDGYIQVDGGGAVMKLASLTMYAEQLVPEISFVGYNGNNVSITHGRVPLLTPVHVSLGLTSGQNPVFGVDDYVKVQMVVDTLDFQQTYENTTFEKDDIRFKNANYRGQALPFTYKIEILSPENGSSTYQGDLGEKFTGSLQIDDIYMTEQGNQTPYRTHKNIFYFEKSSAYISFSYDLHGKQGNDDFIFYDDEEEEDILFDRLWVVGLENFPKYAYSAGTGLGDKVIKLIGGQISKNRDKIYEDEDMEVLNDKGLFLSDNKEGFTAGFNYNVVKLRMRDENKKRYFILKIMGPTDMEGYTVKWTFSDDSVINNTFDLNGMIWESRVEPERNLKEVEMTSPGGIVLGKLELVDFATHYSTLYGIDENQFVITKKERFEKNANSDYQVTERMIFVTEESWTDSSVDITMPVDNPSMELMKVSGVDMLSVADISFDGTHMEFFIDLFSQRPLKVMQPPNYGSLVIDGNRIVHTVPAGYTGVATFRIDLYGGLSNPRETFSDSPETYMKAIESRYLDARIDYTVPAPVLTLSTVYKSPIELGHYLEFNTPVTSIENDGAIVDYAVSTYNDHQIDYDPESISGTFSKQDTVTLNGDFTMATTWYKTRYGSRRIDLPPGQTHVFTKSYIQALFYHKFEGEIAKLQPSTDVYAPGFNIQFKMGDQNVDTMEGGNPMDTFDTLEIADVPTEPDGDPVGLQLTGRDSSDDYEKTYIYFFSRQGETVLWGDIDGNGKTDIGDLILVLQLLVGMDQPVNASHDINDDGTIGTAEAIHLFRKIGEFNP